MTKSAVVKDDQICFSGGRIKSAYVIYVMIKSGPVMGWSNLLLSLMIKSTVLIEWSNQLSLWNDQNSFPVGMIKSAIWTKWSNKAFSDGMIKFAAPVGWSYQLFWCRTLTLWCTVNDLSARLMQRVISPPVMQWPISDLDAYIYALFDAMQWCIILLWGGLVHRLIRILLQPEFCILGNRLAQMQELKSCLGTGCIGLQAILKTKYHHGKKRMHGPLVQYSRFYFIRCVQ